MGTNIAGIYAGHRPARGAAGDTPTSSGLKAPADVDAPQQLGRWLDARSHRRLPASTRRPAGALMNICLHARSIRLHPGACGFSAAATSGACVPTDRSRSPAIPGTQNPLARGPYRIGRDGVLAA